jgi:F-type H+-transporting ATPase subunit c
MNKMKKTLTTAVSTLALMLLASPAFAQSTDAVAFGTDGLIALAAGIGMALGTFGGALGQGRTASAAVEGIARNPQAAPRVQTPMIIALALTESLVLFTFVIAFFLQGKIG